MSEWDQTVPTEPPGEPVEPLEPTQPPAEPLEGESGSEGPRKRRRGPVSLEEQLGVLLDRKERELDKLKGREAALLEALDKVRDARVCAEADLGRLLAVRSSG